MSVRLQFFLYMIAPLLAFTVFTVAVYFRKSWPKWLKTANLVAVVAAVFIPYSTFVVIIPMLLLNGWFWTRLNDKDGTKPWAFIQNDTTYVIIAITGVLASAYWWVDSLEAILLLTILTLAALYGVRTYLARKSREDTPTSLLESAVCQWYWLEDVYPQFDQFNSLHERLVERWRELPGQGPVHVASIEDN